MLQTNGDYKFAATLNHNLEELTASVKKLTEKISEEKEESKKIILTKPYASTIVDVVEDFLEKKGVSLEDSEDGNTAIIKGEDFDELVSSFEGTFAEAIEEAGGVVKKNVWSDASSSTELSEADKRILEIYEEKDFVNLLPDKTVTFMGFGYNAGDSTCEDPAKVCRWVNVSMEHRISKEKVKELWEKEELVDYISEHSKQTIEDLTEKELADKLRYMSQNYWTLPEVIV